LGKSLAEKFIRSGDNVVICSRGEDAVRDVVGELQALADQTGNKGVKVRGLPTNVARAREVAALANFAVEGR